MPFAQAMSVQWRPLGEIQNAYGSRKHICAHSPVIQRETYSVLCLFGTRHELLSKAGADLARLANGGSGDAPGPARGLFW